MTAKRYGDKLSFTLVPDIEAPGAFDDAVKDVDGVIHTASPYHYPVDDNERDLFHPAVNGTLRMLEAVHASGNSRIKRVVITSSFAAIIDTTKGYRPGKTYTEADWNPMTWNEAKVAGGGAAYCASKAFAEKAAWDFIEQKKPVFSITTLCPPMVFGPIAHYVQSVDKLNTSSAGIRDLVNGSKSNAPSTEFPAFANVDNLAIAHKIALEKPEAANKRYLITSGPYLTSQICDIARENFPQLKDKIAQGHPDPPLEEIFKVSNERATKELGIKWTSLEQTIIGTVHDILAIQQRGAL